MRYAIERDARREAVRVREGNGIRENMFLHKTVMHSDEFARTREHDAF